MKFKLGILVGGGIGYVLGTRAGEERYEKIRTQYQKLRGSEPVQQVSNEIDRIADQTKQTVENKAQESADQVTGYTQDKI